MTRTTLLKSIVAATAIGAAAETHAGMDFSKSFFGVDAGASFIQTEELKNSDGHQARFNPGVRTDIMWGLMLNDNVGIELQTGVVWNHMKRVGVEVPPVTPSPAEDVYENGKGELYQIPLLLNVVYKITPHNKFSPYIGAGAGGELALFDATFPSGDLKDNDFTFAYQAFGGISYCLCPNANVGIAYKFLGTTGHDWKDNGLEVKTDQLFTHAVVAALTWSY
jgi:opacity protein-like surface antigen